ncbi:hypothetical protein B0T24DRAFT_636450 [Lasiosphaeria ovina]|uniref:Uncharacterized protein n=1 Tax=Lasiosphaeria ovina TaxID=92902 RepID=A0AAE0JWG0_9PEZI|nr:hypothetical protein B0T24DRAFT_636450 [Lasiosphaeria ovina]
MMGHVACIYGLFYWGVYIAKGGPSLCFTGTTRLLIYIYVFSLVHTLAAITLPKRPLHTSAHTYSCLLASVDQSKTLFPLEYSLVSTAIVHPNTPRIDQQRKKARTKYHGIHLVFVNVEIPS